MTFSGLVTRSVTTPNQGPRIGVVEPTHIVHHHYASKGFNQVINSWHTGAKQGSCHVTISNSGEAVGIVAEELRAWSLSSEWFDSRALTTEIENESVGGTWPVSAAAHEQAAQLTADWCRRYRIPCTRQYVIDHGEVYTIFKRSYPTACAGGLDVGWVVARARIILGQTVALKPLTIPTVVSTITTVSINRAGKWIYWEPNHTGVARRIQIALKNRGRYDGVVDDVFGKKTRMGVQKTLNISECFIGLVDGVIEGGGCLGIQVYAKRHGRYIGPLDSQLGINSWIGFALGLELP